MARPRSIRETDHAFLHALVAYRCGRSAGPPKPTIRQSGYIGKQHNDAASVASAVTSHSFDNDSSIDIVGERLGLLRGAAAELARPGQSVDSSFGGRYRCRNLIKRIGNIGRGL